MGWEEDRAAGYRDAASMGYQRSGAVDNFSAYGEGQNQAQAIRDAWLGTNTGSSTPSEADPIDLSGLPLLIVFGVEAFFVLLGVLILAKRWAGIDLDNFQLFSWDGMGALVGTFTAYLYLLSISRFLNGLCCVAFLAFYSYHFGSLILNSSDNHELVHVLSIGIPLVCLKLAEFAFGGGVIGYCHYFLSKK